MARYEGLRGCSGNSAMDGDEWSATHPHRGTAREIFVGYLELRYPRCVRRLKVQCKEIKNTTI